MTLYDIRRQNLRTLARKCGGITQLAKRIERSQPQLSHVIGENPIRIIGDRLANYIEQVFDKPRGWLDTKNIDMDDVISINHPESPRKILNKNTWSLY